jgi:hypothetical protein
MAEKRANVEHMQATYQKREVVAKYLPIRFLRLLSGIGAGCRRPSGGILPLRYWDEIEVKPAARVGYTCPIGLTTWQGKNHPGRLGKAKRRHPEEPNAAV